MQYSLLDRIGFSEGQALILDCLWHYLAAPSTELDRQ